MALNFPASPDLDDIHTDGNYKFQWDGDKWVSIGPEGNFDELRTSTGDNGVRIRDAVSGFNLPAQFDVRFGTQYPITLTNSNLDIATNGTDAVTIDSSQRVGIGTTSPAQSLDIASTAPNIRLTDTVDGHSEIDGNAGSLKFNADKGNEKADSSITFFVDNSQKATIDSNGNFFVGTTDESLYGNNSSTQQGFAYLANSELGVARWQNNVAYFNRMGNDGDIIRLIGQGTTEGYISVSGSTVSYTGGHLSRLSQLAGNAERIEILRGSVLSNLDEMCEWGEEDNEQLNRMKVSDVEGDPNVSGVFQSWDDDDEIYLNDFTCAMTGDFVIRIAQGVTVARGDLLMSAGDGTAKPQDDDIIRSKTIAKVTSTVVSETYADGSYCVPCVLMAC